MIAVSFTLWEYASAHLHSNSSTFPLVFLVHTCFHPRGVGARAPPLRITNHQPRFTQPPYLFLTRAFPQNVENL
jgi:hypothetical protein